MANHADDSTEDYNPHGEHVVEIPPRHQPSHAAARRSYTTLVVAGLLALGGIAITVGLIADRSQRAGEDAAQREELRVGWQILGTLSADGARNDASRVTATSSPPAPASPSIVIVNGVPQAVRGAAPNNPSATDVTPNSTAAAPTSSPALSNGTVPPQPIIVAGAVPPQPALRTGTALPSGSVPAPSATPSISSDREPLSPVTFPFSQMCGLATCDTGSVCCNSSCGICTAPDATCSQQAC